jgi:rhodanese-related sulfurtransferase
MSVWNKDINAINPWDNKLSDKYTDFMETKDNPQPAPSAFTVPETGLDTVEAILNKRIRELFKEGPKFAKTSAEEVLADNSDYFIINYERKDKYDSGHLPGAVRYKPGGTLGIVSEMATIPADKKIAVYCGTGHNSAFATAYLRLFGFDAKSITAGNNSFMHDKMLKEEDSLSWQPFKEDMIFDYPYETGK